MPPPTPTRTSIRDCSGLFAGNNLHCTECTEMASPKVGDTRKTSNGCKVADRVPRKQARFRKPSDNIAAIDFGTANCSLAYVTAGHSASSEEGPVRLQLNTTYYRVPTAILFNPDGSVNSLGYDGREEYRNLDDEERLQYAYFEQIKMTLQHEESVNRDMKITASNGKQYYLVDVIAQILNYLKSELISQLQRSGYPLEATDFDWVITVPAIWRARGKQMMREAGYKAGLCSGFACGNLRTAEGRPGPLVPEENAQDKLSLALEPESAAIFCQNMRKQQLASSAEESLDVPFTSNCYAVIDIGGGTVDITVCQVSKIAHQQIEALHHPAGNDCGGARVNKEFQKFLGNLVDDEEFSEFINTNNEVTNAANKAYLNEIVNDTFEKQKRIFGKKGSKTGKIAIQLPFAFMHVYRAKLQRSIQQLNDPRVKLSESTLRLAYTKVDEFFRPIADGLVRCISETLESVDAKIDTIYLVGGFGGSCYVCTTIKERLGTAYKYIVPVEPDFAVVRGAVLFRQKPRSVQVRRADATYGIRASIPFIEGVHEEDYKWVDEDGKTQCGNIFSTFVERGDLLTADEVVVMKYTPSAADQRRMHFDIYCSSEKDVWYTTGRRPANSSNSTPVEVNKVADLIIPLDTENRIYESLDEDTIELTFDFGHTEIKVKAFHPSTKTNMMAVLDFLSS